MCRCWLPSTPRQLEARTGRRLRHELTQSAPFAAEFFAHFTIDVEFFEELFAPSSSLLAFDSGVPHIVRHCIQCVDEMRSVTLVKYLFDSLLRWHLSAYADVLSAAEQLGAVVRASTVMFAAAWFDRLCYDDGWLVERCRHYTKLLAIDDETATVKWMEFIDAVTLSSTASATNKRRRIEPS